MTDTITNDSTIAPIPTITPIMENDSCYIPTKELYEHLEFSRHQKLKEKIQALDIQIYKVREKIYAIRIDDLVTLLNSIDGRAKEITFERSKQLLVYVNELRKGNSYPLILGDSVRNSNVKKSPQKDLKNNTKTQQKNTKSNPNNNPESEGNTPNFDTQIKNIRSKVMKNVEGFSAIIMTLIYALILPIAFILRELSNAFNSKEFIFLVLLTGLYVQVNHNATLFASVSEISNPTTKWTIAYLFGIVAELTALLLTIHKVNEKTIKQFAYFTFTVNLLYYKIWENITYLPEHSGQFPFEIEWSILIVKIVQSGFLAYVIYSYSQLFILDSVRNSE